jgi:hypothetical protein
LSRCSYLLAEQGLSDLTPRNIKFSAAWMANIPGEPLYWYRERGFGQPDRYIKFATAKSILSQKTLRQAQRASEKAAN